MLFVTRSPEWAPPGVEVFAFSAGIDIVEGGSAGRGAVNAGIGRTI
ncbi:hypothetical protein [Amycolatopsis rifamycinica]|nr:hypothetical protein [Amycolatopsis rifamycinica]